MTEALFSDVRGQVSEKNEEIAKECFGAVWFVVLVEIEQFIT